MDGPVIAAANLSRICEAYLLKFSTAVRKAGEILVARDAVSQVSALEAGQVTGRVRDLDLYRVVMLMADFQCVGSCTCHEATDCKHCYAVIRVFLRNLKRPRQPPTASEAGQIPDQGSPRRQKKPSDSLVAEAETRLGRPLDQAEKGYAKSITQFYRDYRDTGWVPSYLLEGFGASVKRWSYEMKRIWPAAPKNPWEAWLYVAHYLREQNALWPRFLAEVTPVAELDAFVADWHRQEEIKRWREQILKFAADAEPDTRAVVDLRAVFEPDGLRLEWRDADNKDFVLAKKARVKEMERAYNAGMLRLTPASKILWEAFRETSPHDGVLRYDKGGSGFGTLLRHSLLEDRVLTAARQPFYRSPQSLVWRCTEAATINDDYRFQLAFADGSPAPPPLLAVDGRPSLYLTADTIFEGPSFGALNASELTRIPAPAIESAEGVGLLDAIGVELPPRLSAQVRAVKARLSFRCEVRRDSRDEELLVVKIRCDCGPTESQQIFTAQGWQADPRAARPEPGIARVDRSLMSKTAEIIQPLRLSWNVYQCVWERKIAKNFPIQFAEWAAQLPEGCELELDPLLATLRESPARASLRIEVEESGVDWFDLRVALDVGDTTLTPEEIRLLLDARGGFVRIGPKGWRRVAFDFGEDEERQLAELGLDARDFSSEPQRLHALQLAGNAAARLLPERQVETVRRCVEQIQTRVAPDLPALIQAELRPYQMEGFHFLAYLSANHFGGILADDMGLGKTLQTLTWLAWLRAQPGTNDRPSLVVCPKSVMPNWAAEARHFMPSLRVRLLDKGVCDENALEVARAEADLIVANYTQLRLLETALLNSDWHVVVLDEAQYIKNPDSQTARIAVQLRATHRLALTGTPIENRLLDLWSIMAFAMPGVLGPRARFAKSFDQKADPLARIRLGARVRPFVVRRTKGEVARDLPARTEADVLCELEGIQAMLYRAELKRARQQLLKLQNQRELDKARFNILTSLLRLRQICCHPGLVSASQTNGESAKLAALLDLLEPLVAEGHKVLVFSQFVEMLSIIRREVQGRGWRHFLLTGQSENRGSLVEDFQNSDGAAVFLISLRAGGFGLNLTAASYVILFDPWWNPAVENQAIDRTHRIGQTCPVNAYRLLVKDSIEEKIRQLQKQKKTLAADILGEENFARTLTLEDFRFLLEGPAGGS
ncbi:MAG: SNF2-related protein [Verrucomicrobiales bacterium]